MLTVVLGIIAATGFDTASLIAIIAGVTGAISGAAAYVVQNKEVRTKADTGYVDRNLAAMQAIIDRQTAENVRLLGRIDKQEAKIRDLTELLDECQRMCDECLDKVSHHQPPVSSE